jgi:hypothetical protein
VGELVPTEVGHHLTRLVLLTAGESRRTGRKVRAVSSSEARRTQGTYDSRPVDGIPPERNGLYGPSESWLTGCAALGSQRPGDMAQSPS